MEPGLQPAVNRLLGPQYTHRLDRSLKFGGAFGGAAPLSRIATVQGTDKWGRHFYADHYERHLRHLRLRRFVLLEVGVGGYNNPQSGGASLRMWKRFFPRAQIVGLDLSDKRALQERRIAIYQGDQTDASLLRRIVREQGRPTVVVDDGSHIPAHVRSTFDTLFPLLLEGGIYAMEDLQTSYWPAWGGSQDRSDPTTSMSMVKGLVDGLNYEEYTDGQYSPTYTDTTVTGVFAYHNLVFVRKGLNVEGSVGARAKPPAGIAEAVARGAPAGK